MLLLGSTELLLISKCTSFATLPKAMMVEKGKPIAQTLSYDHCADATKDCKSSVQWGTARPGGPIAKTMGVKLQEAGLKTRGSYFYCSVFD
jgi:hypothetical protein